MGISDRIHSMLYGSTLPQTLVFTVDSNMFTLSEGENTMSNKIDFYNLISSHLLGCAIEYSAN